MQLSQMEPANQTSSRQSISTQKMRIVIGRFGSLRITVPANTCNVGDFQHNTQLYVATSASQNASDQRLILT